MEARSVFSRRQFLAAAGTVTVASRLVAAVTAEEKDKLPVIAKKVEKIFNNPVIKHPNDLQFVADGLWIMDQADPNKLFKVKPEDGTILEQIQTESMHGSGITIGNGFFWLGSTKGLKPGTPPVQLKVDMKTGKTLGKWETPESAFPPWTTPGPNSTPSGAHGMKWVKDSYWMAVPSSGKIFLMEAETGKIIRSIPGPGLRSHGIALDNGLMWCVESNDRTVYKLDPKDGKLLAKIPLPKDAPTPHGLDMVNGVLWYCDADGGWVCKLT